MKLRFSWVALTLLAIAAAPASAQTEFKTPTAGSTAQGVVVMCLDGSNNAVPATAAGTCLGSGGGGSNVTVVGPVGPQASTAGVSVTIASDQAAVAVKNATAANLNATVVGTGTLAVQNTAATPAGSAIIGKVGIDQTTPGTTNGVQVLTGSTTAVTQATASNLNATVVQTPATAVSTSALAANQVIVSGAGKLTSFEVSADTTLSAADWWIMVYNATSAPADGAVTPVKCYRIPSGGTSANYAFNSPIPFSTGITIGVSTTGCFTKTASTHAFISGDFQ